MYIVCFIRKELLEGVEVNIDNQIADENVTPQKKKLEEKVT